MAQYSMEERRSIVKTRLRERKDGEESNFWQQVFYYAFDETSSVIKATEQADKALNEFRARFPLMELDDAEIDNIYKLEIGQIEETKPEEVNGGSGGSGDSSSDDTAQN